MEAQFEKIRTIPAYRVLAEAMIERILDGRLREGDPLPTEAKLCEMFGVNRSTVREGIRVLEEANLVRREHAKKMVVTRPSDAEVGKQLERALVLHEIVFDELWQAMSVLEPPMARLAAARATPEALERLDDNLRRTELALKAGESLVELDIEFHGIVAAMSGNRALVLAREPLSRLFYPAFAAVMTRVPVAGKRLLEAHKAIVAAIRAGDEDGAQAWMEKHVQDFRRGYQSAKLDLQSPVAAPHARPVPRAD
ncbi:FadR/GntR family transcriptional regulator [Cupriavidus necator]|uniref:FadR/GntR family transcriptional regulator n=1 Tax=Cupriavidus necator TaxID=106590 RepID=UPI0005B3222C|nr:FCD domain-containing protein [Cupriavidus necator]